MFGETHPTSTALPDPVLSSVSLAAFAATTVAIPRPASLTLDVARHHAFTGEITFAVQPAVRVYLDGGVVYHAEREGEVSVSQALLDGGIVDAQQLERGMVRVGDVEHLGRLFERDATIDRDAVMVVVEYHTDLIVSQLANFAVAPISISAYRHHPSGLHRWFAAPIESPGRSSRPVSEVAQVDRSVVEELPDLGRAAEGIIIEWDEPDPAGLGFPADSTRASTVSSDFDVQAELDQFDADHADWAMAPSPAFGAPGPSAMASPLGEFHIVWPDGTAENALAGELPQIEPVDVARSSPTLTQQTAIILEPAIGTEALTDVGSRSETKIEADSDHSLAWPVIAQGTGTSLDNPTAVLPVEVSRAEVELTNVAPAAFEPPASELLAPIDASDELPAVSAVDIGPVEFAVSDHSAIDHLGTESSASEQGVAARGATTEPLHVDHLPAPDAAVPNDVAAAVRRALQAIDEASLRRDSIPRPRVPISLPRLEVPSVPARQLSQSPELRQPPQSLAEPLAALIVEPDPPVGFAPPTMSMRAEVMYEQQIEAQALPVDGDDDEFAMVPEASSREPGKASVVFVDEQPTDTTERRGALRRLIKSLRNGD
jgi:hypothetical protein